VTDPYTTYLDAATALDSHLNACTACAVGVGCPTGDDIAEREFRADRELHRRTREGGER
jgi:hypothetical protein